MYYICCSCNGGGGGGGAAQAHDVVSPERSIASWRGL